MTEFLAGAMFMGCLTVALFFFRFWSQTRDRLFLMFGLAFLVFAANRVLLLALEARGESTTLVYLSRLFVFLLIIGAVVDRNTRRQ